MHAVYDVRCQRRLDRVDDVVEPLLRIGIRILADIGIDPEFSRDRAFRRQAARITQAGSLEVWAKDMEDGSKAVGLFNRGENEALVTVKWYDLGLGGKMRTRNSPPEQRGAEALISHALSNGLKVRDLWRQNDLGRFEDQFQTSVPRHGVVLVKVSGYKSVQ